MNGYRVLFACATILFVFFNVANAGGKRPDVYASRVYEDTADAADDDVKVGMGGSNYTFTRNDGTGYNNFLWEMPKADYEVEREGSTVRLSGRSAEYTVHCKNENDAKEFEKY